MATITITKTASGNGIAPISYKMLNAKLFNSTYDSGLTIFAMPEAKATDAILTKALGSSLNMTLQWTVKDETASVSTEFTILTAIDQWKYLMGLDNRSFPPESIEDAYTINIDGLTLNCNVLDIDIILNEGGTAYDATMHIIIGASISDL